MNIPNCSTTCIAPRHSWRSGLREFGCDEVATGLGRTGVVGVIKGRKPAGKGDIKVIGLRADMDALPIEEATNLALRLQDTGQDACLRP